MGALKRFIDKHFGMRTQAFTFDMATVNGIALAASNNPDRLMLTMVNLSDTDMVVSPDKAPTALHGIQLASGGGSVTITAKEDGELTGYEWNVFCTAIKSLFVLVTEGAE